MLRCFQFIFILSFTILYSGCHKIPENQETKESREYWENAYDKNWQQINKDGVPSSTGQSDADSDSDGDVDTDIIYREDEPTDYDPGFGLEEDETCAFAATMSIGKCRPETSACVAGEGNDFDRLIAVHFPGLTQYRGSGYSIEPCQRGLKCCIYQNVCSDINTLLFESQLLGDPSLFVADRETVSIGCQVSQCTNARADVNPVGCKDRQYCCPQYY